MGCGAVRPCGLPTQGSRLPVPDPDGSVHAGMGPIEAGPAGAELDGAGGMQAADRRESPFNPAD